MTFILSAFSCTFCYAQENADPACFSTPFVCVKAEDFPSISYSPMDGVQVTVKIDEKFNVVYMIEFGKHQNKIEVPGVIEGVPKSIIIDDYNFDGLLDFAIVEYDGGMGTSDVYRVFTYLKKENRFRAHSYIDGNPLLNLVVDKKRKRLLVTCWSSLSPQPRQCKINIPKEK
jgi:hypothetical protein